MHPVWIRQSLAALMYVALACWHPHNQSFAEANGPRPHIILVMADDQGWGDMSYNGHPTLQTPNFDQMAASGLKFNRFYAAAPVCSPTRGSVLTGRHPNRFGCFRWGHSLRPQEITIAEVLREAGYRTGHFGKWHLGSVRQGSPVNPGASGFDSWFSAENFFDNDAILSREGRAVQTRGESSEVTVDAAIEFIRNCVASDRPCFSVIWFGSPHGPHIALDHDRAPYASQTERQQHFLGEITAMDRAFGKLRHAIRELGVRNNTLIWYCSDNGALPRVGSTGGHRGTKGKLYDGGLLVPSILEWPAVISAPRTTNVRCNTCDIFPTLLSVARAGRSAQPPLDGIDLTGLFADRMQTRPQPMGFWDYPAPGRGVPSHSWMTQLLEAQTRGEEPQDPDKLRLDAADIPDSLPGRTLPGTTLPGHAAWIHGDWKLHRIVDKRTGKTRIELYNLESDPFEAEDLSVREANRARALEQDLLNWQRSVVSSFRGQDYQ